jgi:hypothetical protein
MKPQMKRSLTRMLTLLPRAIPDLSFAIASELHLLLFYQSTTVSLFMLERRKTIVLEMCSFSSASNLQWNIHNYVPTFRKWKVKIGDTRSPLEIFVDAYMHLMTLDQNILVID